MDFSNVLFSCSSWGYLMTEPKSKADREAGNLSESAKTHIVDIYVREKYNRKTDIHNKYLTKGLMVEEDAITLYSRVKKEFYKKNEDRLSNEFIKGTPDLFTGKEIKNATKIIDIKSSWDLFTFFRNVTKGISDIYYWQLQGYMALTGAKTSTLAFCLVDTPETLLMDEKKRLMWKMNVATELDPLYVEACAELDKSMRYDDIPMNERVLEFIIERNDEDIERGYERVKKARTYLTQLEISLCRDVLLADYDNQVKATIIQQA